MSAFVGQRLIIFNNRVEPQSRNAEVLEVIKVVCDSLQIAPVPIKRVGAVGVGIGHVRKFIVGGVAIGEAVGQNQIH